MMPSQYRTGGMEVLCKLSSPANPTPVRVILLTAEIEKGQIVEALQLGATRGRAQGFQDPGIVKRHTNGHGR